MSNKKFYGFCCPGLKESSQEIIHSQDVWSSDFCLLDPDSCKTLYQTDNSRCPPTRRRSSWSWHQGSRCPPQSWGSSWGGWARRELRRTGEQSGRARAAPRKDLCAGTLKLLLQRPTAAKMFKDFSFWLNIHWYLLARIEYEFPGKLEGLNCIFSSLWCFRCRFS